MNLLRLQKFLRGFWENKYNTMANPKFNYRREYEELETHFIDPDYLPLPLNDETDDLYGNDAPGDYQDWPVGGLKDTIAD